MLGIHHPVLFCGAVVLIALTPGPDTLCVLSRTLSQGKRGGLLTVGGIALGCLTHTLAAAAGLSALLYASALAFASVKLLGAVYLVWIGVRLLRAKAAVIGAGTDARTAPPIPGGRIFLQGYLTNVLNPKVALFFLAFLPQFLDAEAPHHFAGLLALGIAFTILGNVWNALLVFGTSPLVHAMRRHPRGEVLLDRLTGGLFIALGIRLAFAAR